MALNVGAVGYRLVVYRASPGPLVAWCADQPPPPPPPLRCSLREGVPTEAVSVGVCLSEEGQLDLDSVEVVPSLVQPARRLT